MRFLLSLTFITLLLFPSLSFGFDQGDLDRLKKTNECAGCDLSGANLGNTDLFGANLEGANLKRANLRGANLGGANLKWAKLTEADLSDANLTEADLSDATLSGTTNLRGANLKWAKLGGANLYGANITEAYLESANLTNVKNFPEVLKAVNLEKLKTTKQCKNCYLVGVSFDGADLRGVNLTDAYLEYANLSGADLQGANFSGVNLEGANLEGANLSESNLTGADLQGANFSGANLEGANLSEANLRGADLNKANLRGANLKYINLKYIKNPPKIIIDKLKKLRIKSAEVLNWSCHMDNCNWMLPLEVRDSRFPNDPIIGWHPQKRVIDQKLKNPFVVEFLVDRVSTHHHCVSEGHDGLISCAKLGSQNDEYPSNWEEDYPDTFDEFTYKFQKYIKWEKQSMYFHCSKQFPAILYVGKQKNEEIEIVQFSEWYHMFSSFALYFHFCHNKIFDGFLYDFYVDFDYPSLAKELGYPEYVYNAQLPAPTFPSWDALVNYNK